MLLNLLDFITQLTKLGKYRYEEEVETMALKQGEVYRCPDSKCGCEITVTKGAQPGGGVIKLHAAVAAWK
jgi:hypothetical protein